MSAGTEQETEERAYVYMVRCAGGQLYTGWTNDPGARLHAHKTGRGAKATRAMGAERFAYLERCVDRSAALRREGHAPPLQCTTGNPAVSFIITQNSIITEATAPCRTIFTRK